MSIWSLGSILDNECLEQVFALSQFVDRYFSKVVEDANLGATLCDLQQIYKCWTGFWMCGAL